MMTDDELRKLLAEATPGPWKVCESTIHGKKYGGCWVEGADIEHDDGLLHVPLIPISGSGGAKSYTTRIVEVQCHDHNDPNARLIAAAPDLAAEVLRLREALWAILAPAAFGCPAQDRIEAMRDEAREALGNKQ